MSYYPYSTVKKKECFSNYPVHCPPQPCPPKPFPPSYCDHTKIYNDTNNPMTILQTNPLSITGYAGVGLSIGLSENGVPAYPISGTTFSVFSSFDGANSFGPSLIVGSYETGYSASLGSVLIGHEARSVGFQNYILGNNNSVAGSVSFSVGNNTNITGIQIFSLGNNNKILGRENYSLGSNNTINSWNSYSLGHGLNVSGNYNTYAFGKNGSTTNTLSGFLHTDQPNIQLVNEGGVPVIISSDHNANGFIYLNGSNSNLSTQHLTSRGKAYFLDDIEVNDEVVTKSVRSPSGDLFLRSPNEIKTSNRIALGEGTEYSYMRLSGGNSKGALWGAYTGIWVDKVNLSYNYYIEKNGPNFIEHIPNTGGSTSAVSAGYGKITFNVGGVNQSPKAIATVEETRISPSVTGINLGRDNATGRWENVYAKKVFAEEVESPANTLVLRSQGDIRMEKQVHIPSQSSVRFTGGNSDGTIWVAYTGIWEDKVNLSYNYYIEKDGPNFVEHIPNIGGGTSVVSPGYGRITFNVGGVNQAPKAIASIQETRFLPSITGIDLGRNDSTGRWENVYAENLHANNTISAVGPDHSRKLSVSNNSNTYVFWVDTIQNKTFILGSVEVVSDEREKEDISDINVGVNLINLLKPKVYRMKKGDSKKSFGLLAQDVLEEFSDLGLNPNDYGIVSEYELENNTPMLDENNEPVKDENGNVIIVNGIPAKRYAINYNNLIAPMIKSIQELSAENELLRTQITNLNQNMASIIQSEVQSQLSNLVSRIEVLENNLNP